MGVRWGVMLTMGCSKATEESNMKFPDTIYVTIATQHDDDGYIQDEALLAWEKVPPHNTHEIAQYVLRRTGEISTQVPKVDWAE